MRRFNTWRSATGDNVTKSLRPESVQPSELRVAVVSGRRKSVPASVAVAQITSSPAATARSIPSLRAAPSESPCAFAPRHICANIRVMARCMLSAIAVEASARPSRSIATAQS